MGIRDRGSRMHVLDWIEGRTGDFVTSINATLAPTGVLVAPSSFWMPISRACPQEARPFRRCPGLLDPAISGAGLNWWLAVPHPLAETPNIDLAVRAKFPDGKDGLVLVEAKAHCAELKQ